MPRSSAAKRNDIELIVLVGFEGHGGVVDIAVFQVIAGGAFPIAGIGGEVATHERLEALQNEGAVADLVLGAVPPVLAAFGDVLFLGGVGYPQRHNRVEVRSGLAELELEGGAVFLGIVSAGIASAVQGGDGGLYGLHTSSFFLIGLADSRAVSASASAPFGSAQNFVGDLCVFTSGLRVDIAHDRILVAHCIQRSAIGVLQTVAELESQLGRVGTVFPALSRAGDGFQGAIQLGQTFVHHLQVAQFR